MIYWNNHDHPIMNNDNQMEWIDDMDDLYIYTYIYGIDNHPIWYDIHNPY